MINHDRGLQVVLSLIHALIDESLNPGTGDSMMETFDLEGHSGGDTERLTALFRKLCQLRGWPAAQGGCQYVIVFPG